MMTFLTSIWPVLAGAVLGLGGLIVGLFKHQETKTAKAQATDAANQAQAAKQREQDALATAAATKDALDKVQAAQASRAATDAEVSAMKPGEAQSALINEGFAREQP